MYDDPGNNGGVLTNPIKGFGFDSPHAAAVLVIGALAVLILVRRGFRGVGIGGASVRIG